MQILAFPGQMVQRWPRTGRSRDPLRRWAQLARIRPYGGKSHPESLNPASESLSEQVLTLLSLTGRFSLSWLSMPPCCLLQMAVGAPHGRVGVRVRSACLQTREVPCCSSATAAVACSFPSFSTGILQYHSIRTKNPNPACSDLLHLFLFRVLASLAATVVCDSIYFVFLHSLVLRGKAALCCELPSASSRSSHPQRVMSCLRSDSNTGAASALVKMSACCCVVGTHRA